MLENIMRGTKGFYEETPKSGRESWMRYIEY